MNSGVIIKSGAICSFIGIFLFIMLIGLLLAFPVVKQCIAGKICKYSSTAPEPFLLLINPAFASLSLSFIAAGVLMFRLGLYYTNRKK